MSNDTTNPVTFFEIATDDPAGARSFYGDLFGWSFENLGPFTMISTGPDDPVMGGIADTTGELPTATPRRYTTFYVQVTDVAGSCRQAEELGAKVVVDATPIPTGLVYALVTDPAGNLFGLFSPPPPA
jgi:uncharacterized protein